MEYLQSIPLPSADSQTDPLLWDSPEFIRSYAYMEREMRAKQELYEIFVGLLPNSPEQQKESYAVDIGSGLSTIKEQIMNKGYNYIGIDASAKMLHYAQKIYSGNLWNAMADITDALPFPNKSIDLITGINVLYSFSETQLRDRVLPEISRIMKPDGVLQVSNPLPNASNFRIILRELQLRGNSLPSAKKFLSVLFEHRNFLKSQSQLARGALKLDPLEWVGLLADFGFTKPYVNTEAYAGQASIIKLTHR